jgi:hypothetical protein
VRKVELNDLPPTHGFRERVQHLYVKVSAASKRSKSRTLKWLQAVESCGELTLLEAVKKRWDDLDTALAEAVIDIAKGPLKRELLLYQEQRTRQGHPLTGRAALWHVYQRFILERGQAMCIDLTSLVKLTYGGDLEGFIAASGRVLMSLAKLPDEEMMLALLETQHAKSWALPL